MITSVSDVDKATYIQPYLLCEFAILIRFVLEKKYNSYFWGDPKIKLLILGFISYSVTISVISPFLFEGTRVIDKNIDESFLDGYDRLAFGKKNINQILYVLLNMTTLLCVYIRSTSIKKETIQRVFVLAVFFTILFGYWEYISKVTNIIPFPSFLIKDMNLQIANNHFRMSGLCGEASMFGTFVSPAFWALLCLPKSKLRNVLLLLSFGCVVLCFSGSAYLGFIIGFLCFLVVRGMNRFYVLFIFILFVVFYFGYFYIDFIQDAVLMLLEKGESESGSGQVRWGTTLISMEKFFESYGLGIGLGSTRSSSFLADLLAGVGVIGTTFFLRIFYLLVWKLRKFRNTNYLFVFSVSMLCIQILSMPDFSYCYMWMGLFLCGSTNKASLIV